MSSQDERRDAPRPAVAEEASSGPTGELAAELEGIGEQDEESDEEEQAGGPPDWVTQVEKFERSIFELHRRWKQKRLDLQPEFQRAFVWHPSKQVRLVESVLAKVPLPAIYLSEESEVAQVIDGQQRLTSLFRFLDDGFPLGKSRLLEPSLHFKKFSALPPLMQRRFEDAPLICFVVQRGSSKRFKFELFERLNQGATVLTPQEIRDAIYRGRGLSAISDFAAQSPLFEAVVRKKRKLGRGADRELILRGIAWQWRGLDAYAGNLKRYLNDTLELLNQQPAPVLADLVNRFGQSLAAAQDVLGRSAFDNPESKRLNAPLFDALTYGFAKAADLAPWAPRADRLRQRLAELWQVREFRESVTGATDRREKLLTRISAWAAALDQERAAFPPNPSPP